MKTLLLVALLISGCSLTVEQRPYESPNNLEGRWQGVSWVSSRDDKATRTDRVDVTFSAIPAGYLAIKGNIFSEIQDFPEFPPYAATGTVFEEGGNITVTISGGGSTITYVAQKKDGNLHLKTIFDHKKTSDVFVWKRPDKFFSKRGGL